jgi:hypothetical protein
MLITSESNEVFRAEVEEMARLIDPTENVFDVGDYAVDCRLE